MLQRLPLFLTLALPITYVPYLTESKNGLGHDILDGSVLNMESTGN